MQHQNTEIAAMMTTIADSEFIELAKSTKAHLILLALRTDVDRKHMETLEAVRATAAEQVPFNVQRVSHSSMQAVSVIDHARIVPG